MRTLMLLLPMLVLALGCGKSSSRANRGKLEERLPKVEVVHPKLSRLIRKIDVAATVEALKKVDLAARVPGVVGYLPDDVDLGRKIKTGEIMLKLDVPDLVAEQNHKKQLLSLAKKLEELAEKSLVVAKKEVEEVRKDDKRFLAEVEFTRKRWTRIAELVRQGAQDALVGQEAQKQYESAVAGQESNTARTAKREARVESAVVEIALAKQRIAVAQAELEKINRQIEFSIVRAPFDGVITRRWIDPGAIIKDPGATLFTVVQMHRVRVLIDVPQRDVQLLNSRDVNPNPGGKGDRVEIRMPVLSDTKKSSKFEGFITRVSRSLDPITRTMRAEIEVDNVDDTLRPGMFGSAAVTIEDRPNVMTIPASALVRQGEGMVEVFIVSNPQGAKLRGVLKRIPVQLGIDDGKRVEVRGLKADDLVVERGASVMRAEDEVYALESDR